MSWYFAVYFGAIDERFPSTMREKSEESRPSVLFKVGKNFRGNPLLIFKRMCRRGLLGKLQQDLLNSCRFCVDRADGMEKLIPRVTVRSAIFASVDGVELPLLLAEKRLDSGNKLVRQSFNALRIQGGVWPPKLRSNAQVLLMESFALHQSGTKILRVGDLGRVR